MGLWTGKLLPGSFNALPLQFESTSAGRSFRVVEHSPANFTGGFQEPLGAEARTIKCRLCFAGSNFEGHKLLTALLDAAVVPLKPSLLVHPVWGDVPCYPTNYETQIDFAAREAVVELVVKRHDVKPEIPVLLAEAYFQPFPDQTAPLSGANYAAALGWLSAFQLQMIQAALTIMRLTFAAPVLVKQAPRAWGAMICNYFNHLADPITADVDPQYYEADPPPASAVVRKAFETVDGVAAGYFQATNLPRAKYDAIAAGGEYQAGVFHSGAPDALATVRPSSRFHAALFVVGQYETIVTGKAAAALANNIRKRSRLGAFDAADVNAAVNFMRRRLARAVAVTRAGLGAYAPAVVRELSRQGAQLLALQKKARGALPSIKSHVVNAPRPLVLIVLDLYGDVANADAYCDRIRALNHSLRADLNRLPVGTVLTVPAA